MLKISFFIMFIVFSMCSYGRGPDAKITIIGTVKALPCVVDNNNYEVDLGSLFVSDFKSPGSYSEWRNLSLTLSSCPEFMSKVNAKFEGTPSKDGKYYLNDGTSSNILIELQDSDHEQIIPNMETVSTEIDKLSHSAVFNLRIRAITESGNVTKGNISSSITVTYVYE